ncbi:MAG: AAA family ATPase [Ruminococcus sp.]|nr:AAA family ATPase [Ruminococcus sp.]
MIDAQKTVGIIESYKQYFPEHWEDEKYKWEAVKHFQDNWDIEAENFGTMFKKATDKTFNLLASGYAYPRGMILEFAKADDTAVREMFRRLFDESLALSDRVTEFMKTAEELRNKYNDGTWKQHYQNTNYISTYLWLMYPDKYYIYKYELYRAVAKELDDSYLPKKNGAAETMVGGFKMYDEICEILNRDTELRQMLESSLTDSCYKDSQLRTMTVDFGFYLARFYNDSEEKWFPSMEEYTPGFSVEDWLDLLNNKDVFDESSLIVIQRFYEIGGQATCSELAQKYGNTAMHYSGIVSGLAKRIHKKTNCPVIKNELSENSKWWPILFVGKDAEKQQTGAYVWRLRDELKAALDIKLADIQTDPPITRCWFVGAYSDSDDTHQDEEYIAQGIWQNGYTNKFLDTVNSIKVGDKIAIKTSYTKKKGLPFDNHGETISVMNIKIVGTVTANHMDGRTVDVDWDTSFQPKEWYFYTFRNTITLPKADDWRTRALLDFVFHDVPQDYAKFKKDTEKTGREDLSVSNSEFLKYFAPLIQALKDLGGSATRKEAHEKVIELMDITEEELSVTYEKTGASRVLNQIDFARNDLAHEGFISSGTKGVWALTELGMNIDMTMELAGLIHMKWVKINTAKRKGEPIPEIDLSKHYKKKIDRKYTKEDFLKDVFLTEPEYDKLRSLVLRKKNIILQGAPGVGKTFSAKRLAYSIIGEKNENRICMVQFHQNYSYEDFIMGYRPNDGGGFELQSGVFYNFCIRCKENPDKPYFFIIDEINRGNLSKIFGELLMLIETDKRGEKHKLNLVYGGTAFYIPENLHIIGMMNTADRSLAMIDYALRRRFSFYTMQPAFENADQNGFGDYKADIQCELYHSVIAKIRELNDTIRKDSTLGKGFEIGHSYFAPENRSEINDEWVRGVVEYEIIPLIEEYWFDNDKMVDEWTKALYQVIGD